MKKLLIFSLVFGYFAYFCQGPALADRDKKKANREKKEVEKTIARFKERDPGIQRFFDHAYGYAVFPDIGGGAMIVGFVQGEGLVFESGKVVGRITLNQTTVGLQAGGKNYREIIFFKDKAAFDRLKSNTLKLAEQASAVVVTAGASTKANYDEGVAVFTLPKSGLMVEYSIGGQQFKFQPSPDN